MDSHARAAGSPGLSAVAPSPTAGPVSPASSDAEPYVALLADSIVERERVSSAATAEASGLEGNGHGGVAAPPPALLHRPRPAQPRAPASVSALTRPQRAAHLAVGGLWMIVSAQFWIWWVPRAQGGDAWLALIVSLALAYQAAMLPTIFWWFVGRMRHPLHRAPAQGLRTAMVTLCVPSVESLEIVENQLRAMQAVRYPHDSWILDEGDSPAVRELAHRFGVHHFTRKGIERWNQPGPPHQRKTKAGNVNAWLSSLTERELDYDVFVQLDIDHQPDPSYLDRVLGYFDDPGVAWIQSPSVCRNLDCWAARGLAEQELVFQGPLQMGFYGFSRTPFIIGSHTAYRTSAIREIGGFQPTRAEDHLDTVVLAARGYRGVFVPDTIARGDGPEDLPTYLRQQFAWAHSMITVLLSWTPRLVRHYKPRVALQFLFSQTWYLLWSISMLVLWAAPLIALAVDRRIAATSLGEYLVYFIPVALAGWLMWAFARPWFRPQGLRISWRAGVLTIARWPTVLWALVSVLLRIKRPYMITPKGMSGHSVRRAAAAYGPLLGLGTIALATVWLADAMGHSGEGLGYVPLVLFNALVMVLAAGASILLDVADAPPVTGIKDGRLRVELLTLGWLGALVATFCATTVVFSQAVLAGLS